MNSLLYIYWKPDEIAFHLGSFGVRWYSMCWLVGLVLGFFLMKWLYKRHHYSDEKFEPLFLYVFISVLIGGRLGHCIPYEGGYFLSSWDHVIEMLLPIRHMANGAWKFVGYQGLASHGGVIGMLIGLWLYIRRYKMPAWVVLDFMGICSGITATFIRLGNLMNSEIIGKVTDVPWAFIFANVDQAPRHPGQLYESLFYLLVFFVILAIYKRHSDKVGTGFFFGLCLTLIFTFRFFVEFLKEEQESWEASLPLNMGQMLSIPLIALGLWALITSFKRKKAA